MRRYQLQLAVFRSGVRLAAFTSGVAPELKFTKSTHPHPPNTPRSLPRSSSSTTLPRFSQTSIHDVNGESPIRFLHKFESLIREIEQNCRNFAALRRIDDVLKDVEMLDCVSLVFVVKGLCRVRKLVRAKNVVKEMRRRVQFNECFLYSVVFDCLVKDGRIDEAELVWNEVCGNEAVIDVSDYVVYVCRFGGLSGIRNVCERVLKDGKVLRDRSYAALVGGLCRNGLGSLAKEVVHVMDGVGVGLDDLSYFVMYRCYCRNGELDDADWILRRLVKRGFKMDVSVFGSFLHGLCKCGKVREADKLFRKLIRYDGVKSCSDVELMRLGRRAIFQLDFAVDVVSVMMAYETYFRSLCSVGKLDEAEKLFKEMMKMSIVPQTCVYASFIKALFTAGRVSDAVKFYNLEKKKQHICTDEILGSLVRGLCESGEVDNGLTLLDEVASNGNFIGATRMCNDILSGFWKENKAVEAETLFERMNNGAYGLPEASSYSIMIHGFCHQGNISKALGLLEKMFESKVSVSRVLYEIVISELSHQGRLSEAHELLNSLLENGHVVSFDDCDQVIHSYMTS